MLLKTQNQSGIYYIRIIIFKNEYYYLDVKKFGTLGITGISVLFGLLLTSEEMTRFPGYWEYNNSKFPESQDIREIQFASEKNKVTCNCLSQ